MRNKNSYEVRFDTYRRGVACLWVIHVDAYNLKEAKDKVEQLWYQDEDRHMFHMTVRRIPEDLDIDYKHWFTCIRWEPYKGNRSPYLNLEKEFLLCRH